MPSLHPAIEYSGLSGMLDQCTVEVKRMLTGLIKKVESDRRAK